MAQRAAVSVDNVFGPTPERLAKAGGQVDTVSEGPRNRKSEAVRMRDEPLEWLLSKNKITNRQYDAGRKFYAHWYLSGGSPLITPQYAEYIARFDDPHGAVFASERREYHAGEYRKGIQAMGLKTGAIVQQFVCESQTTFSDQHTVDGLAARHLKRYGAKARSAILAIIEVGLESLREEYRL